MAIVVPLAGDVDRNVRQVLYEALANGSSPSRGTWIEMPTMTFLWSTAK